ncbi:type VII secretion system-associated protein [Saccharopolyspora sp. NPDC002578]
MSEQPDHPEPPPITDEMREQARQTPNSWLYIVDPGYQESGDDVPPEGVVGAYHIDADGEIDPEFQYNDEYEPSDLTFALPEPVNELERVLHRIATGEAPDTELAPAVLAAEVLVYDPENGEGEPAVYVAELDDGSQLVPACTSAERVPESWPGSRRVPGGELPELLGGLDLGLNLDDAVRAVIPHHVLNDASSPN